MEAPVFQDHGKNNDPAYLHPHSIKSFQARCTDSRSVGSDAIHGFQVRHSLPLPALTILTTRIGCTSGYLESCRSIVTCARYIADAIVASIPELYLMGDPPASVIAFASKHPNVNIHEVGDKMSTRGWHLNALNGTPGVHIACTVCEQRLL